MIQNKTRLTVGRVKPLLDLHKIMCPGIVLSSPGTGVFPIPIYHLPFTISQFPFPRSQSQVPVPVTWQFIWLGEPRGSFWATMSGPCDYCVSPRSKSFFFIFWGLVFNLGVCWDRGLDPDLDQGLTIQCINAFLLKVRVRSKQKDLFLRFSFLWFGYNLN